MKMTYSAGTCEITTAQEFFFHSEVPCNLEPDTIRYAVCRVFQKNRTLRRHGVYQSWQMRVSGAHARKRCRHTYLVPAALMELPGSWAQMTALVDGTGVTVECLELLREFPILHSQEKRSLENIHNACQKQARAKNGLSQVQA